MISLLPIAYALDCPNGVDPSGACKLSGDIVKTASDLIDIIDSITNWMFTLLLILAVGFVVFAAYKYLTSGGGEETGKAHKMLLYAAVAVAVAVLSRGVINVVKVLVGGESTNNTPVETPQNPPSTEHPSSAISPTETF